MWRGGKTHLQHLQFLTVTAVIRLTPLTILLSFWQAAVGQDLLINYLGGQIYEHSNIHYLLTWLSYNGTLDTTTKQNTTELINIK